MPRPRLSVSQTQRLHLTPGLQAAIHLLRADAAGLTRYLEEQAELNPHLRLDPAPAPAAGDWLPRWSGVIGPQGQAGAASEALDHAEAPEASLIAHVMGAIDRIGLAPPQARIAAALVEALEPSGWLGKPLAQIAHEASAPEAEVEAVLKRLQRIEPAGLFARSLAECLALQLAELGQLDGVMQIVLGRLDLLAAGDLARLARLARQSPEDIAARFRIIRGLDPKPGAQFAPLAAANLREPDLLVRRAASGAWEVALNRSCLPTVSVRSGAAPMPDASARAVAGHLATHPDAPDPAASGQATSARPGPATVGAARAVARLVNIRNDTLLRVGREVLMRQRAALEHGPAALVAMRMAEVAEALGLHESTVSRVVAGASVDTPRGTWWLRRLFSAAAGDNTISGAGVQARLARLVAAEPKGAPLSDAALAEALAEGGAPVARRTVAKYRAALGIPAAHRRRARPREKLQPGA